MSDDTKDKAEQDIFEALNAKDIPDEEKATLLAQMMEVIQTRVLLRISEQLAPEDIAEFERLAEAEDEEATDKFLDEKIPGYNDMFAEEANKLKQELIIDLAE